MKPIVRLSIFLLLLTISFGAPSALAANKALSLDGDEDYVSIPHSSSLDISGSITVEVWFKMVDINPTDHWLVVDKSHGATDNTGWLIQGEPTGEILWGYGNDSGFPGAVSTMNLANANWHHAAGVLDGSEMRLYIDGLLNRTVTLDGSPATNTRAVNIGAWWGGGEFHRFFTGPIDEVRIWNIARTQEEIREGINQPIENPELLEDLVGYWNFDDGTADDLSQYGNDGALQGDATIVESERAKVIFVPTPEYPTIQDGIDAASPGDTVVVDPGIYDENVTLKSGIRLQGSGADVTTIDGGGNGSVVKMPGISDVTVSGFTITNGLGDGQDYQGGDNGGGIAVFGCSNIVIRDNIITQNHVNGVFADGGGILISKCTESIIIWQNSIVDNYAENWGGGICIQGTFDVRIDANDISNNDAVVGDGISLWEGGLAEGASAWIINSRIADNQGDGIYIGDGCSALIGGNRDNANDIFGNTEYAVRNDSTNTIDATYNYWGTTVEQEIRDAIWDYYDDASNGIVNYKPWTDGGHRRVFPFAQALDLDGDGDLVEVTDVQFSYQTLTLEAWVYMNDSDTIREIIGTPNNGDSFQLEIWEGQQIMFDAVTMDTRLVSEPDAFHLKKWHHITGVYDGTTSIIYVDGRLVAQGDATGSSDLVGATIRIGSEVHGMSQFWDGLLDEVRIWNIARTQEEIQETMNTTLQGDEEGLVGYWNFDDGTANDSSLHSGNHGTLMGDAEIVPLYGTWPPPLRGDLSGDGTVSAYDAALILQYVVGLINEFPADLMVSPSAIEPHDYEVSLPQLETPAGGKIQVPIAINDATGLLAGGITVKYDSAVLRAVDYASLKLLNGYYWKANTNLPGEVRFAFASAELKLALEQSEGKGQGNLLMVEFEVLPNTEGKTSPLILENVNLSSSRSIKKNDGEVRVIPSTFALLQNFPNPFNPDTWLPYKLASASPVSISIYNAKGQLVRTLHLGHQNAGVYVTKGKAAYWDGKDNVGEKVGSGVYFYTLQVERQRNPVPIFGTGLDGAGKFRTTRKMVIVK